MMETQVLLSKIAALRQRLEQAHGIVREADSQAVALLKGGDVLDALQRKVAAGAIQQTLLDSTLRQIPASANGDGAALPAQLTARAARLLRRAHELLGQLRPLAEAAATRSADPLAHLCRESVSMTETVLRTIQAFPEAPSAQVRLCEGLEAVLGVVTERLATLTAAARRRGAENQRRQALAEILAALAAGCTVESKALLAVAESVLEDAAQGERLEFPPFSADDVVQHVAGHSLAVAQVMARLARHDPDWRTRPLEPVLAALVHDVGMVKVPAAILGRAEPLRDEERRQIEAHTLLGAEMAARIAPSAAWLVEAAGQHHERLDGTGYPNGLREIQVKPLIRLLAICDVYTAMCQPRPHRAALDTRTALTDTLLLAEKGGLDRQLAERLLLLSFYPVGTIVELSDGSVGLVVATHQTRRDLNTPARPVVSVLSDHQGQPLPAPRVVDLSAIEGRTILRGLSQDESRERLGKRYLEWAS
jgi:HD-GYP domain-containing protein (c-di-GMP phosphodiesterase class II)